MKTISLTLFLVTVFASAFSQSCPRPSPIDNASLIGSWKGHYTMNGELYPMVILLKESNGDLSASIEMGKSDQRLSAVEVSVCESEELHFRKVKLDGANIEFIGKPENGVMSGRLTMKKGLKPSQEELFSVKLDKGV